jgi:hypothetical protein
MGSHDQTQIAERDAADPERAVVAALERAERAAPGSLSAEALARVSAWREAELARKAAARAAGPVKGVELGGGVSEVAGG